MNTQFSRKKFPSRRQKSATRMVSLRPVGGSPSHPPPECVIVIAGHPNDAQYIPSAGHSAVSAPRRSGNDARNGRW